MRHAYGSDYVYVVSYFGEWLKLSPTFFLDLISKNTSSPTWTHQFKVVKYVKHIPVLKLP